jgi:hypothetical protein
LPLFSGAYPRYTPPIPHLQGRAAPYSKIASVLSLWPTSGRSLYLTSSSAYLPWNMPSKTPEEPEDRSHNTLQFFPHHQAHMLSAPCPSSSITTVTLSPAPSDLPIAPLGPISPTVGTTSTRPQSWVSQEAAHNTAPADSPSTVTDSSRQPGAEYSDGDSEASPSHEQVSAKQKKKKRTRTLTTAPQAAALFALLAQVSLN